MCTSIENTCRRCGNDLLIDEESGCLEGYSFEESDNMLYCPECYDAIVAEREAEDARIEGIWNTIRETLDKYDVNFKENHASTASHYFNCSFDPTDYDNDDAEILDGVEFKIRVADHNQCYDADINVAISESNADGIPVEKFEDYLVEILGIEKK